MPVSFTTRQFCEALRAGPYAWPGGYPCYFLLSDGETLSFKAAREEIRLVIGAIIDGRENPHETSGWRVVAVDINWEDEDMVCAHSGERIESAYGE